MLLIKEFQHIFCQSVWGLIVLWDSISVYTQLYQRQSMKEEEDKKDESIKKKKKKERKKTRILRTAVSHLSAHIQWAEVNPLYTGGLFHCHMLAESICHF